jgi:hypothetical protein
MANLPSLEVPERGDCCPSCGSQRVITEFCGPCASVNEGRRWYSLAMAEDLIERDVIHELVGRGIVGRS